MLRRLLPLALALALVAGVGLVAAVEPETEVANDAVEYIKSLQNADGGFPAFGAESSPGATLDAVFALVAAGEDPLDVTSGGNSPADYLATQWDTYSVDAGGAAKLMLGVVAMGLDPVEFFDLPSVLEGHLAEDPSTGVYGFDMFDQALSVLALVAAAEPVRPAAVDYLRLQQRADGGWEFSPGSGSDSNTTAMALQALLASGDGPGSPAVLDGLAYLRTAQNAAGGFGFLPGADSDPNSTALVIQALVAAGQDIGEGGPWAPEGHTPLEGLLTFRNPETGAFQYAGEDSPFATYQAVPALMLAPFPDLETRVIEGPTPQAPTVIEVTATPTVPVGGLPPAGQGARGAHEPWWALAALLVGGAGALGAGALRWRSR